MNRYIVRGVGRLFEGKRYLTAVEAAEALGVSLPTLYAYVSRGLVRSEPTGEARRTRQYPAQDVQRLAQRREFRHDPAKVAADALDWGVPIMETELTYITEDGPFYRGRSAIDLARAGSIEDVAALFWTGKIENRAELFEVEPLALDDAIGKIDREVPLPQRVQIALALALPLDVTAYDLEAGSRSMERTAVRILRLMADVIAPSAVVEPSIARTLRAAWCPAAVGSERILDAALILCADHELSVSTFNARVAASAAANLYLVVTAALATLQGFKHGGHTELVEAFLREADDPEAVASVVARRLKRGETLPGFGHILYPSGDPRATALLAMLDEAYGDVPALIHARSVMETVEAVTGRKPTIDFALVALARALNLAPESAFALFALGRTVGWIGHAIEQYRSGQMIRPRATYVGPK
jgi:citrate synthase